MASANTNGHSEPSAAADGSFFCAEAGSLNPGGKRRTSPPGTGSIGIRRSQNHPHPCCVQLSPLPPCGSGHASAIPRPHPGSPCPPTALHSLPLAHPCQPHRSRHYRLAEGVREGSQNIKTINKGTKSTEEQIQHIAEKNSSKEHAAQNKENRGVYGEHQPPNPTPIQTVISCVATPHRATEL